MWGNWLSNNTNINNNKNNNNNSNQINSFQKEIELKGNENSKKSILEIQKEVLADFNAEQTLPYIYTHKSYHRHLKQAIQMLSEYQQHKKNATDERLTYDQHRQCEEYFSLVHIFSEALFKMLSTEGNQNVNGRNVTYAKVYDELVHYIKFTTLTGYFSGEVKHEWLVRGLMDEAISNYTNASLINEIKHPVPYMITCIWTAMENGDVKLHDLIRYDFGGY